MVCIPPKPKRVGYIDSIHGPLDGPLYMCSHIHQQYPAINASDIIYFKVDSDFNKIKRQLHRGIFPK